MRFVYAAILIFLSGEVSSQAVTFKYSYNVNDGLSDNRVYNIARDERGFMWSATHNGLSRFDGKNFIYGITNMKTRIAKWSGEITIMSENGKGTTIIITLPFQKTSHIKRIFSS